VDISAGLGEEEFDQLLADVADALSELLAIDVTLRRSNHGQKIFPSNADGLMLQGSTRLDKGRIATLANPYMQLAESQELEQARADIEKFCESRRLIDLVPGHMVFGFLRRVVLFVVRKQSGRNLTVDNDALRVLLAGEIWSGSRSADHESLRRRLLRAVREAEKMRSEEQ